MTFADLIFKTREMEELIFKEIRTRTPITMDGGTFIQQAIIYGGEENGRSEIAPAAT